jgi:Ca2+/Na+ antiporter
VTGQQEKIVLLAAFYVFAIVSIILHYTGHLKRWNCEWILIVLAIAVFPAVLFL